MANLQSATPHHSNLPKIPNAVPILRFQRRSSNLTGVAIALASAILAALGYLLSALRVFIPLRHRRSIDAGALKFYRQIRHRRPSIALRYSLEKLLPVYIFIFRPKLLSPQFIWRAILIVGLIPILQIFLTGYAVLSVSDDVVQRAIQSSLDRMSQYASNLQTYDNYSLLPKIVFYYSQIDPAILLDTPTILIRRSVIIHLFDSFLFCFFAGFLVFSFSIFVTKYLLAFSVKQFSVLRYISISLIDLLVALICSTLVFSAFEFLASFFDHFLFYRIYYGFGTLDLYGATNQQLYFSDDLPLFSYLDAYNIFSHNFGIIIWDFLRLPGGIENFDSISIVLRSIVLPFSNLAGFALLIFSGFAVYSPPLFTMVNWITLICILPSLMHIAFSFVTISIYIVDRLSLGVIVPSLKWAAKHEAGVVGILFGLIAVVAFGVNVLIALLLIGVGT
ncbi:MAG: hypothetical protein AAGA97_00975 [Pseudomonadota bacterium]